MLRRRWLCGCAALCALSAVLAAQPAGAAALPAGAACASHWVGSWIASPSDAASPLTAQTARMIVAPHLAGEQLRVRLSNRFGQGPVTLGPVTIAETGQGAALQPGTVRQVLFGGRSTVTIPLGGEAASDTVALPVRPFQDLSVSVVVPGAVSAPSEHFTTRQTNYLSAAGSGDHAGDLDGASYRSTTDTSANGWYFLDGIDVLAPGAVGGVATFGDSITDGFQGRITPVTEDLTYIDQNLRYPDDLARRLLAAGRPLSVLNAGISGNRVLQDGQIPQFGRSAISRVHADVVNQPGVTDVIILEGINDIGQTTGLTADQLIAGLHQVVDQLHGAGLRVLLGTLTPSGGTILSSYGGNYGSGSANDIRQQVNAWIRTQHVSDAVVDFDAAVRDPQDPSRIAAPYDGSDHLHFSPAGYQRLADTVDLSQLRGSSCATQATTKGAGPGHARGLRLTVSPRSVRVGRTATLRFHVTLRTGGKAVRAAVVRFHCKRARTNRHGDAVIHVRLTTPGRYTATATAHGSRATTMTRALRGPRTPRFTG